MKTETEYLRGELIRAKALLAECAGLFDAADSIAPEFAQLPIVNRTRGAIAEFRRHGVAVLPEGVKANA